MQEAEIKKIFFCTGDISGDAKTLPIENNRESFAKRHGKAIDLVVFRIAPIILSVLSIAISCSK